MNRFLSLFCVVALLGACTSKPPTRPGSSKGSKGGTTVAPDGGIDDETNSENGNDESNPIDPNEVDPGLQLQNKDLKTKEERDDPRRAKQ